MEEDGEVEDCVEVELKDAEAEDVDELSPDNSDGGVGVRRDGQGEAVLLEGVDELLVVLVVAVEIVILG